MFLSQSFLRFSVSWSKTWTTVSTGIKILNIGMHEIFLVSYFVIPLSFQAMWQNINSTIWVLDNMGHSTFSLHIICTYTLRCWYYPLIKTQATHTHRVWLPVNRHYKLDTLTSAASQRFFFRDLTIIALEKTVTFYGNQHKLWHNGEAQGKFSPYFMIFRKTLHGWSFWVGLKTDIMKKRSLFDVAMHKKFPARFISDR